MLLRGLNADVSVARLSSRLSRVTVVQTTASSFQARLFGGANQRVVSSHSLYQLVRAPVAPVAAAIAAPPRASTSMMRRSVALASSSQLMPMACGSSSLSMTRRFQATASATGDAKASSEQQQQQDPKAQQQESQAAGAEGEQAKAEAPKEEGGPFSAFSKLSGDIKAFPDIYNSANMLNMILFTVFCLCSTGTEGEAKWWENFWSVDDEFKPWAWPMHSLLCTNFLAMTFAMILFHALSHQTMAQIGSRSLMLFLATVATSSGILMYGSNKVLGDYLPKEKQFGPWDVIAALMVMQYLAIGQTPWGLLLSYNGWIRYANIVGGIVIIYYDPQPIFWGTLLGLALCKGKVFPPIAAAAA